MAGLVLKNVVGNGFRSFVVVLCVLVMAGFAVASTVVIRGAEDSLRLGLSRLGADIIVVPEDSDQGIETALLMGTTATQTLPAVKMEQVAGVPGVAAVSPQLYLGTVHGLPVAAPRVNLVAFDPASDFTVQPWLSTGPAAPLGLGEAIGGSGVAPAGGGATLDLGGYSLALKGNMDATGTMLDQALFVSFDTARAMGNGLRRLDPPLEAKDGVFSAVLVRVRADADYRVMAPRILQAVPGVLPVESPAMFRALQQQMTGLVQGALTVLAIIWGLSVAIVALVFSMSANERRREVAVLRALGSTKRFVLAALLLEAAALALLGGALGVTFSSLVVYLLRGAIVEGMGIPFLFPGPGELITLVGAGVALALVSGTLAALWPALRVSREDPALAMRE